MTNEERMRRALYCIADNLLGKGLDFRPLSYEMCQKLAEFAVAVAKGQAWPEFDTANEKHPEKLI